MSASLKSVAADALPPLSAAARAAQAELERLLPGAVSARASDRIAYARDMWPLALMWIRQGRIPTPPELVVWPKTEGQLQAVVRLARERALPLVPYGAGSGVCGGTWAVKGGVSVDLKFLDALEPVDRAARTVDVGAGMLGEPLERRLDAQGYTLGHFPSSIYMSTVGGWLAARSAGQLSGRYGKIEDMTLSVRAVLGTGELVETPERPASGVDLASLLIGSEGTLGFFTRARLRVHPRPEARAFRGAELPSVQAGLEAIRQIFRAGLRPAVVRLYDPFDTTFVGKGTPRTHRATPPSFQGAWERAVVPALLRAVAPRTLGRPGLFNAAAAVLHKSRLILMFEGEAQRAAAEEEAARDICRSLGAKDLGEAPGQQWLAKRYDVSFRMSKIVEANAFADTMEVAAPWEKVHEVYERVHQAASPHAFVLCHFSHAYLEGCSLYFSFVGSGGSEAEMADRYDALWRSALSAAVAAGANVSHHHGVGLLKAKALLGSLGEGSAALRSLKQAFDPDGIMNPGKLGL
ncbi:MAG: FAD-binding oxidoreductase [Myxococcaceae bacterium]|nr:FAD-binding oxidoreductase [Myxococcaceae bacterium]